jgi:hypothetical protein
MKEDHRMHRGLALLVLVCSLIVALGSFSPQPVLAQASTETDDAQLQQASQSDIVGTWQVAISAISEQGMVSSFQALQLYTADGHIIGTTDRRGEDSPHFGEWRWTGGNQYLATVTLWEYLGSGEAVIVRVRSSLTLDGDSFGGPFEVSISTIDGMLPLATATGTQEGSRITEDR